LHLVRQRRPRSADRLRSRHQHRDHQYLSFPEDATLGAIVRTLVNLQQVSAVVEAYDSTLVMVDELSGKQPCTRRRDEVRARRKEEIKGLAAGKENGILLVTADKFAAESTSVRRCPRPDADQENLSS